MGEDTEKPSPDAPPSSVHETVVEENLAETVVEQAEEEKDTSPPAAPAPAPDAVAASASFVEESYYVKDLKDYEKKALQELKAKIQDAIKSNSFLIPPKEDKAKETPAASAAEDKKDEAQEETAEKKDEAEEEAEKKEAEEEKKEEVEEKKEAEGAVPFPTESSVDQVLREMEAEATKDGEGEQVEEEEEEEEDGLPSLEDLDLWGVPLLHSKGDERTDVVLLKFLRARDFKVGEALEMLKDTVTWRKEFGADGLIDEDLTSKFESVAYMQGVDREGHPVCYNSYGVFQDKELYQKTFGDEAQFKEFLRWRIQVLEKGIKALDFSPGGVHSILQVVDLKDSPGFVKRRNITKRAFSILQDNYPELVAKQIFINVPWYFGALITLHGKIISLRTKSKYVVARPDKATETLFKYISPDNVPLRYGGFSRPNDTEFVGFDAPVKDLTVKAGEKQTIEFPVEEAGKTVIWDLSVAGWEVVYGEEFVPSTEGSYTIIIQKTKKISSSEEPIRNSFKANEPGKVVITIDNTTSWRKKTVVYRYAVKDGDASKHIFL